MFCPNCGNPCTDLVETDMTKCYECSKCGGHYVYTEPLVDGMAQYLIPMAGDECFGCGNMVLHSA